MEQKRKEVSVKKEKEIDKSELKSALENKVRTRTVRLRFSSGCGCGGGYDEVLREVPYDSKLKNGDIIHDLEDGDVW